MKYLKYLNRFFYKYRYSLLLGFAFVIASNVFKVFAPGLIGDAIDLVVENIKNFNESGSDAAREEVYSSLVSGLMKFGGLYLLIALLQGIFLFFTRQTIIVVSRKIEYDLKNVIYEKYQKLNQHFYKTNQTGDLMSRISEDVSRVRFYLGPALMYAGNLVTLIVLALAFMIGINWKLTLIVLTPLPILSISIYYINNLINRKSEIIQEKLSDLTTAAQETYSGIRVVKSYVQESQILKYFDKESGEYKEKALDLARIESFFFPLMLLLIGLSTLLTIYVGGLYVIDGKITTGQVAQFIIYVNMLTWPVTAIGWVASIIQRAAASQKRINEFLEDERETATGQIKIEEIAGKIKFEHVHFTYPETGIKALNDVSFEIKAGERVAIIGRTGSGKSTIAELILRMYDINQGKIFVDDLPLNDIEVGSLRELTGYVPQDVFLFSDTITGNINFGNEDDQEELAIESAKMASIKDEIERFPKGFDTLVGERGVTLSGGQKQRISIARALAKDPKILILDDSLSAVDAETEQEILTHFDQVFKDRTSIVITHRIFSLLSFDKILVLDNGMLAEIGSHDELLDKKGIYFDIYEKQQLEEKNVMID